MRELFAADWPFWLSGLGIGLVVVGFALASGRALGVSRGFVNVCAWGSRREAYRDKTGREAWRPWFLGGIVLGGVLASLIAGSFEVRPWITTGPSGEPAPASAWQPILFVLGGGAIGYGARRAGGCTSGHAITGLALGGRSSLEATVGFMIAGVLCAHLVAWGLGS